MSFAEYYQNQPFLILLPSLKLKLKFTLNSDKVTNCSAVGQQNYEQTCLMVREILAKIICQSQASAQKHPMFETKLGLLLS